MPLFCRKKEMGGAAGTRGKFARGCRKEMRRREEKMAENAYVFPAQKHRLTKKSASGPGTERNCRIHAGEADRRGRELRL